MMTRGAVTVAAALRQDGARPYFHRVLLVGEAPPRDDQRPNLIGQLVLKAFGTWGSGIHRPHSVDRLMVRTRCANLLGRWPGPNGRGAHHGSSFPIEKARLAARQLTRACIADAFPYEVVLLAGRRVQAAMGWGGTDYFCAPATFPSSKWILVPHPSGLNKWWNDPANRREARSFLTALAEDLDRTQR